MKPTSPTYELKSRRRLQNETLRNLHSDIRRLAALALPELDHGARETKAYVTTSLTLWTILTSLSKFTSASRKTLTLHYESLFSWKYGLC